MLGRTGRAAGAGRAGAQALGTGALGERARSRGARQAGTRGRGRRAAWAAWARLRRAAGPSWVFWCT